MERLRRSLEGAQGGRKKARGQAAGARKAPAGRGKSQRAASKEEEGGLGPGR